MVNAFVVNSERAIEAKESSGASIAKSRRRELTAPLSKKSPAHRPREHRRHARQRTPRQREKTQASDGDESAFDTRSPTRVTIDT
ncbi:MAG: hypothetical protein C4334_11515 [Pyrinomonas sp.]